MSSELNKRNLTYKITEKLKKHMHPEEKEIYCVFGSQDISAWTYWFLLGPILSPLFTRYFAIGLTEQRLLIMELSLRLKEKKFISVSFSQIENISFKNIIMGKELCLNLRTGEKYRIVLHTMGRAAEKQRENLQKICDFFQDFKP